MQRNISLQNKFSRENYRAKQNLEVFTRISINSSNIRVVPQFRSVATEAAEETGEPQKMEGVINI